MRRNTIFKMFTKYFWLLLCLSATLIDAEFYSSVHAMSKLVQYENIFLQHMQKYVTVNEQKLDFLKARLVELERDRDEARAEGLAYFDSPLNKYLLTKRLTVDWERIENLMQHNSGKKSLNNMERYKNNRTFPDESELDGAIEGFLRVQDVYRMSTKDMAAGILNGVKYSAELEARHCYDIAKFAAHQNLLRLAHSWAQEALQRLAQENEHVESASSVVERITEPEILLLLAKVKRDALDLKGANATYAQLVQLRPDVEAYTSAYTQFLEENADKEEYAEFDLSDDHNPLPEDLLATDEHMRYKLTCNGLITQSPSEERGLRCGYLTETHPFLLIAPIKVEELNHDPLLVVYYDVVSDAEIAIIKKLSENRIERARVMGLNESIVSPVRTSQFSFLPKTSHKLLETIDVRVEDMTNLNMIFAEDHQFANYGIGGHYAQHIDWFDLNTQNKLISNFEMGNRIATVLFYLTDVEQGGGTAFPYLKRLLMPKKGAAAFWHNLHASGVGDRRTNHGACPIIVGSKWVQNRWIREFVQSDRRPCELYDDTYHGAL